MRDNSVNEGGRADEPPAPTTTLSSGRPEAMLRTASLTARGEAFEAAIGERLRAQIARAYRAAGLDGVAGTRRILAALAGGRTRSPGGGVA